MPAPAMRALCDAAPRYAGALLRQPPVFFLRVAAGYAFSLPAVRCYGATRAASVAMKACAGAVAGSVITRTPLPRAHMIHDR